MRGLRYRAAPALAVRALFGLVTAYRVAAYRVAAHAASSSVVTRVTVPSADPSIGRRAAMEAPPWPVDLADEAAQAVQAAARPTCPSCEYVGGLPVLPGEAVGRTP